MLKSLKNWDSQTTNTILEMRLTPNQSLSSRGTKLVFILIAVGFLLPILPFIGTSIGIALTFFSGITFYLFLSLLQKNFNAGQTFEEIFITDKKILVIHKEKNREKKTWECNPYWTKVNLDANHKKSKNYLTLVGKGRHIELGLFLSPDERIALKDMIQKALAKVKGA